MPKQKSHQAISDEQFMRLFTIALVIAILFLAIVAIVWYQPPTMPLPKVTTTPDLLDIIQ